MPKPNGPPPRRPAAPPAANPFLAASPTPSPASETESPRVVPTPEGAPLRVQRGVQAPSVRDPHAEFRKGGLKKPLLLAVLAAAVVGGLFYGLPKQEEKAAPSADSGPVTVIGASVSPEVIPDPDKPSLQNPNPSLKRARTEEPLPAPVDHPDRSGSFGDAFKSTAQ